VIPFDVSTHISAPRDEVFELVGDLATRVAWMDHFQSEYHLTRTRPSGNGAAARYRTNPPLGKQSYFDLVMAEFDAPRRIVERGGTGRLGRTLVQVVWDFEAEGPNLTSVTVHYETQPATKLADLKERVARRWTRRQYKVALERLRLVFEEPQRGALARASVAAYEPLKAARFG
jgi:uncharacterized protein YndB with AHSA1/START domain